MEDIFAERSLSTIVLSVHISLKSTKLPGFRWPVVARARRFDFSIPVDASRDVRCWVGSVFDWGSIPLLTAALHPQLYHSCSPSPTSAPLSIPAAVLWYSPTIMNPSASYAVGMPHPLTRGISHRPAVDLAGRLPAWSAALTFACWRCSVACCSSYGGGRKEPEVHM
jgi:hypothetical protein